MQNFEIKASEDFITPGFCLDIVAVGHSAFQRNVVISGCWEITPLLDGITLSDGKLLVDKNIDHPEQLTISCTTPGGLSAKRTFKIINSKRKGKLVHFIKSDNLYSGKDFRWNLWTYDSNGVSTHADFSSKNDFGVSALCHHNNVIARKVVWGPEWHNDWSEQTYSFELSEEDNYYIVYGDNEIYTSLNDVVERTNPRIESAIMDSADKIFAHLSHRAVADTRFNLFIDDKKQDCVNVSINDKYIEFSNLPQDIDPADRIEIRANNTFLSCTVVPRNYLNNFYHSGSDMGVILSESSISFRLWAPTTKKVELLLYSDWKKRPENPEYIFPLTREMGSGTHHLEISREGVENKFYLYRLYFNNIDHHGNPYIRVTYAVDPYAHSVSVNGNKGHLLDLNSPITLPDEWFTHTKPEFTNKEDAIIYEMHIRDFTISEKSGVRRELRGKFLGASTTGTSYIDNGIEVTTGVDSLVELGVTHVHLLPIFDFSSVDETASEAPHNRNWGYDPKNYNVPEGSYATDPYNPLSRVLEARRMIQGFHEKGIRVVLDVVYNHMTETANMDNIVPGYYFRSDSLGKYTNGSGCGNELATEHPMVSKFIIDSILHWIKNYKIDGLRLDLMELMDYDTMQAIVAKIQSIDPSILIYGEPWMASDSPLMNRTYRGRQKGNEFSIFNDWFRDALRGNNDPGHGFINGDQHTPYTGIRVIEGLKGSIGKLTLKPRESINYVDAHDNYTLWDHIEKSQYRSTERGHYRKNLVADNLFCSVRVRQNLLALGIILTAQGIPFLQGGVEILRSKNGDHNSYKSKDEVNAIHWEDKVKFKPVFDYVKGLIQLRKNHPAFRMSTPEMINACLDIYTAHHNDRSGVIISHFKNHANNDSWQDIVVIYNSTAIDSYEINDLLPLRTKGLEWQVVVNHEYAGIKTVATSIDGKLPPMRSHSMLVVHN